MEALLLLHKNTSKRREGGQQPRGRSMPLSSDVTMSHGGHHTYLLLGRAHSSQGHRESILGAGRGRGGVGTSQGLPREKEGTWPLFTETSDQLICILYEFSHLVTFSSPFWGRKGPKLTSGGQRPESLEGIFIKFMTVT